MAYRVLKAAYAVFLVFASLMLCKESVAQQSPKKGVASKEIGGRVSGITKDYIAVVYNVDEAAHTEHEVLLPFSKDLALDHAQTLDQIKVGDTVSVEFEEDTVSAKEGGKVFRRGKVVHFVSHAPKETETDVLGATQ